MPDNYSQWEAHELEMERRLQSRPTCSYCSDPVQEEHYFYIHGRIYCDDCMNQNFRRLVETDYYF